LDGMHVVFGSVLTGMEVVRAMEAVGTREGTPRVPVVIASCGVVESEAESPKPKK